MSLLTWNDSYSVGVETIDQQHSGLFAILNELHAAMMKGQAAAVTGALLRKLVSYTRDHFSAEEALMAAAHYPGLEAHCRQHAEFRSLLAALLGRARQMSLDAIADEVKFLVNGWFYRHIITVDFEYAPYLVPGHPGKPAAPER